MADGITLVVGEHHCGALCFAALGCRGFELIKSWGLSSEAELVDKKISGGKMHLIVPEKIGQVRMETIPVEALRELGEETGYTGTVTRVDPVAFSFPALSGATMQLVHIDIDETLSVNQNPQTRLEPGEFIETILVPRQGIRHWLGQQANNGQKIASGLWYLFALAD